MTWQPLETAPKNDERILLARKKTWKYNGWVTIGWYSTRMGWWEDSNGHTFQKPPTHWQPMIQPPQG